MLSVHVVSPKCNSVYELEQCIGQTARGSKYSKHCWYVPFPNHPQQQLRAECGMLLLKPLQCNIKFRPPKIFCYQSLNESITYLFQQKCFLMSIQLWRERNVFDKVMGDVYDGDIWRNFCDNLFDDQPYNLMLFLNGDWFQIFTHITDSVGEIILIISKYTPS